MGGGSQTSTTNQNQQGLTDFIQTMVSGQNVNAASQNTLGAISQFETNQMNNGISQANQQQALEQNQVQDERTINNTMHTLGSSTPNKAGMAEDLAKDAMMGTAQTAAGLGAANQAAEQAGAGGLQQTNALLNPNQTYTNQGGSQQSSASGTSTTTQTSNPGFGGFLGSLLGMAGGAMTGGAAGAGGLGSILKGF